MFIPIFPFTKQVLEATVQKGCHYFVRNWYPHAKNTLGNKIMGCYLITHYNDGAKANAHFNSLPKSAHNFLYDWKNPDHQKKLQEAASQPTGYQIYSAYFLPDYKKKITPKIKEQINKYMYKHTKWKPGAGESLHVDFYLQFGSLYITMGYSGQQIKVKFGDIENEK